jgi:hypothetical protein
LYAEFPSTRSALQAFRAAGGHVRTQTFERLFREYGNRVALKDIETGKDLRFRPTEGEVLPMTTIRATGLMQEALVFGRSRSGALITKRIEVPVDRLRSRAWVLKRAEEISRGFLPASEQHRDTELVAVLGAVHVGAYERTRLGGRS